MKRLILILLCILALPVMASHIVGGEFELIYISGNSYRLNLIIYFDEKNGSEGAKDGDAKVRIFRKSDNAIMMDVVLIRQSESPVSYTQPECSSGEIITSKIIYTAVITLESSRFNDPGGYYVSWERCCRNYSITNIVSEAPPPGTIDWPNAAGQTFYLEFPPVVMNGQPFINSSPRLFPPLNDYACPNRPYYADFAGVDDDGDSLAYTLVTPLNTHTAEALPLNGPAPAPYPLVQWQAGFGINNILKGSPDLKISTDGLLTVRPTLQGLYVFAVKCDEFRFGKKIGELRRDFQMLVVDGCPQATPPQIRGKKLGDADFTYDETMSLTFTNTVSDADRCIVVQVSDPDAAVTADGSERVSIKAIPIGFKNNVSSVLPGVVTATLVNGSMKEFNICFDKCPYKNGPFQIGIVAYDDACSLPLFDTLKITVNIQPPLNQPPYFTSADVNLSVIEGTPAGPFAITGVDADNDRLTLTPHSADAVLLNNFGFELIPVKDEPGSIAYSLTWNTKCSEIDFSKQKEFYLEYWLDDVDQCLIEGPDKMTLRLKLELPPNTSPNLTINSLDENVPLDNGKVSIRLGQQITLGLLGTDADKIPQPDLLTLDILSATGNVEPKGYIFSPAEGRISVATTFLWKPECSVFENAVYENDYTFKFVVSDNRCFNVKGDTVAVDIKIRDLDRESVKFIPPNFVSPNGDELNDFFAMVKIDEDTGELVNILPKDNCSEHFEGIVIYNRWGRRVYENPDRDFRWYPNDQSTGYYYYVLKFTDHDYKGWINVAYGESEINR